MTVGAGKVCLAGEPGVAGERSLEGSGKAAEQVGRGNNADAAADSAPSAVCELNLQGVQPRTCGTQLAEHFAAMTASQQGRLASAMLCKGNSAE